MRVKHAYDMKKDREAFPAAYVQTLIGIRDSMIRTLGFCHDRHNFVLTEDSIKPWLEELANMNLERYRKPRALRSGEESA